MSENKFIKSTAFGGFDRKSVLAYIDEITAKSTKTEAELTAKLTTLTSANDDLSAQIAEFNNQISSLEGSIKDEREKMLKLTSEIDSLNSNILAQTAKINEDSREIHLKEQQTKLLMDKIETLEDKNNEYNRTLQHVGGIIAEATTSADSIIEKAMREANLIKENSLSKLSFISEEIDNFRHNVDNLRSTVSEVMTSISIRLDTLVESIDEVDVRCQKITTAFDEAVEYTISSDETQPIMQQNVIETKAWDYVAEVE